MVRSEDDIRKVLDFEATFVKGNPVGLAVIPHLENIIRLYNELYSFKNPSLDDKAGFSLLKAQYKILCAINRRKANKYVLDGEF